MSTVTVKRPPRLEGPPLPTGDVELQEPPVMAEPAPPDIRAFLMAVPMALGMGGMMLMFGMFSRSPAMYVMGGVMFVGMISMGFVQIGKATGERKAKMKSERRDYLRYIAQLRKKARADADEQRSAVFWNNPDPARLWSIASGSRVWERRPVHDDFGRVRIGLGTQNSAIHYVPPSTKPIEDLEPLSAISLRRFSEAYLTIDGMPTAIGTRSFTSIEFAGEFAASMDLCRAIVGQLATFHAPDELRLAVLTDGHADDWEWVKWLPHNAHPTDTDAAGPVRLFAHDHDELMALLGADLGERGEHDATARVGASEPFIVVIAASIEIPEVSRLLGEGIRNVLLLDVTGRLPGGAKVLRLTVRDGAVEYPTGTKTGRSEADALSRAEAEVLARILAPKRTSGTLEVVDESLESDFELTTLLGIKDAYSFDVPAIWRTRHAQRARLQVPIGVTEGGEVIELDLKESAQGGMGPHGLVIGATGSGKSELLRTLVCALAATHSSEILNLVLVDFKGGATFIGMEKLPHTSAVITNLADELPLVDRMQDALNGEMTRRQEFLRESGYASLFEYEKARGAGAPLVPFPVLLVIVDEFSELLSSKSEFMDLFVSIGRLGRSLGVHLLLASQRLDEGRISRVEGHLSYRIALRTFSSMESRAVIGVGAAYELPSDPGNGYLKVDITSLVRFKSAYVSGGYARRIAPAEEDDRLRVVAEIVPFGTRTMSSAPGVYGRPVAVPIEEPAHDAAQPDDPALMDVLIDRLAGSGPPARQVWLPPLADAPSLDALLPSIVPDPEHGMIVQREVLRGRLRVPVGVVDRPYDQTRDLLIADVSGAHGHVGVVGAPQSGKSTLLRTFVMSLALTHTPREVQFYALDFGGGGIMPIVGLPHTGSVATRMERDRVVRTIAEITGIMERREAAFAAHGFDSLGSYLDACARGVLHDPHGHVFLIIDGWFTLKQDFEALEDRIRELSSRGLSFGIHIVIAATRWSEIRTWLRDLLGTKLELRLGDSIESEVNHRKAAQVPDQAGRGMTSDGMHFLAAVPRLDGRSGNVDLGEATKAIVEEIATFWPGPPAPPVRLLPARLQVEDLPPAQPEFKVCLGHDETRIEPVWHDFMSTPHLLVMGDIETGKTNALRLVLRAIAERYRPDQAKVVLGDPRRDLDTAIPDEYVVGRGITSEAVNELARQALVSMQERMPGTDISSERLRRRDWWDGPEVFVVIDDYDLLSSGLSSVLEPITPVLAQSVHIGLHVIIARSTSGAMRAMTDPVIRRIWELGSPAALLSYPKDEGRFIGEAAPMQLPPGRAQLVTRRGVKLIQTGIVTAGVTAKENA
ncbi:type VII secretion protein EccCa [Actinoplanes sp. NPDC089786]|uniref:type VII secretion protein EccCa n=1 Tax=Actinoplanes sp. NPDC089786 TaxID=3155185 RepID=UPI0034192D92